MLSLHLSFHLFDFELVLLHVVGSHGLVLEVRNYLARVQELSIRLVHRVCVVLHGQGVLIIPEYVAGIRLEVIKAVSRMIHVRRSVDVVRDLGVSSDILEGLHWQKVVVVAVVSGELPLLVVVVVLVVVIVVPCGPWVLLFHMVILRIEMHLHHRRRHLNRAPHEVLRRLLLLAHNLGRGSVHLNHKVGMLLHGEKAGSVDGERV